uniref:Uncharacterized protein n=1 Tax=Arion vulgaris TaxID=1028688 RepID=A0A0B7BC38_9EUPU
MKCKNKRRFKHIIQRRHKPMLSVMLKKEIRLLHFWEAGLGGYTTLVALVT